MRGLSPFDRAEKQLSKWTAPLVKVVASRENWTELVLGKAGNPNFSHKQADNNKLSGKNIAKYIEIHLFQLKSSSSMHFVSDRACNI